MITATKKVAALAVVLAGLSFLAAEMTDRAEGARHLLAADNRVAAAFEVSSTAEPPPSLARTSGEKGDRETPRCAGERWPDISTGCLTGAAGLRPNTPRTVTVEHRRGPATSVLLRMPVTEVAWR